MRPVADLRDKHGYQWRVCSVAQLLRPHACVLMQTGPVHRLAISNSLCIV